MTVVVHGWQPVAVEQSDANVLKCTKQDIATPRAEMTLFLEKMADMQERVSGLAP